MLERVWSKRNPPTLLGNANWDRQCGKQNGSFFTNHKVELPYDHVVPLLGIYLEKTTIQKDTCTPMFIAALFTIAWTWKQPRRPSTDEWIRSCGTYTQ